MRKATLSFTIILIFCFHAATSFAGWTQENPYIKGGTLDERSEFGMASVGKGRILLMGGRNSANLYGMNDTWVYDVNKGRWTKMSPLFNNGSLIERFGHAMAYLGGETVLLHGGSDDGSMMDETWIYSIVSNTWTKLTPSEIGGTLDGLRHHGLCYIDEGKVLLFGGYNFSGGERGQTWLYDLNLNQWELLSPAVVGEGFSDKHQMGMAYIGNGQAIMFGGRTSTGDVNDTWVYDLGQNQWTKMTPSVIGGVLSPRLGVSMAHIGGDRVLIFGGWAPGAGVLNEIWMYDLSDNQWTNLAYADTGMQPVERDYASMTYAGLGQAVMFGGKSSDYLSDTWRFSLLDEVKDDIAWQIVPGALELSWFMPEEYGNTLFSIYRDGAQISPSVAPGAPADGIVPFVYMDHSAESGKIYRYQIKEHYPIMNSEIFYPKISVPFCP